MKEKKKKRKILAALIPVLIFLLAVALLAQGVLKSEPEAVPNPVQGISADSSLKGYLGTGFAYAGSKTDGNGEEALEQQEQAQLLPEETPTPTVTPEPTKEPVPQTVTPTPKPEESVTPTPQATVTETPENNNNTNQNQENQSNTIEYDNHQKPQMRMITGTRTGHRLQTRICRLLPRHRKSRRSLRHLPLRKVQRNR